jgi:adenosylmethionine-8-amino-7-oxononanoate aminotransferase
MLASKPIIETVRDGTGSFQHGHTYLAHPLACAAALEVQRIIREEGLLERVKSLGKVLEEKLSERFANHRHIGDIRGRGLFQALELVEDRSSKRPFSSELKLHQRIKKAAFEAGLACYPTGGTVDGRSGDHVLLAPPYIATAYDIDLIVDRLGRAVDNALKSLGH